MNGGAILGLIEGMPDFFTLRNERLAQDVKSQPIVQYSRIYGIRGIVCWLLIIAADRLG